MKSLYGENVFYCPHCNIKAKQDWYHVMLNERVVNEYITPKIESYYDVIEGAGYFEYEDSDIREDNILAFSMCHACGKYSLWSDHTLVYPQKNVVKPPSDFMPSDVKEIYQEASGVLTISPRASSALLRLALERLLPQVGAKKDSINNMIGQLVSEKKIMRRTKEAMDALRIIGNDSIHSNEIVLDENRDEEKTALTLFRLLNRIVNETIGAEKELEEIYNGLPKSKLDGIKNRDQK